MKITKSQLKEIIREELQKIELQEAVFDVSQRISILVDGQYSIIFRERGRNVLELTNVKQVEAMIKALNRVKDHLNKNL